MLTLVLLAALHFAPPLPSADPVERAVERSHTFNRLAVRTSGPAIEALLVERCVGPLAPRSAGCRPAPNAVVVPSLRTGRGATLVITTGQGASTVYVRTLAWARDATPIGQTRTRWRVGLPPGVHGRMSIDVSPLVTDSGSFGFAVQAR